MTKSFCTVLGVVLLSIGVIGGMTGGHDHELLIFGINANHNVVHIASGVIALLAAFAGFARAFCLVFGAVYGAVAIAGFLDVDAIVTALNLNTADNFLHIAIAAACLYFGFQPLSLETPRVVQRRVESAFDQRS